MLTDFYNILLAIGIVFWLTLYISPRLFFSDRRPRRSQNETEPNSAACSAV